MTRRLTCGTETGVGGEGARLMILLQFGLEREMSKKIFSSCISDYPALTCIQCTKTPPVNTDLGQAILWELPLQMRRQLQGHRTYLNHYYCVNIWTSHLNHHSQEILLSARRRIPDRRCLVARVALHHMLVFLARDVDHCLWSHCLQHCLHQILDETNY